MCAVLCFFFFSFVRLYEPLPEATLLGGSQGFCWIISRKKREGKRSRRFTHVTRLVGKQIGAGRLLCGFCPDVQGCDANIEL